MSDTATEPTIELDPAPDRSAPEPSADSAPAVDASPELEQSDAEQQPKPKKLRFVDNEIDIPPETPDSVYEQLEKVNALLNKGVTQKFQEAAERMRMIAEKERALELESQRKAETAIKYREFAALSNELEPFEKFDWVEALRQARDDNERNAIEKAYSEYQIKLHKYERLSKQIEEDKRQEAARNEAKMRQWVSVGDQILASAIPEWGSPEKSVETKKMIVETMSRYGVGNTHPELDQIARMAAEFHPAVVMAFYKAALYDKTLDRVVKQPTQQGEQQPRPVARVGGSAKAAKNPDQMSDAEWSAMRQQERRRERAGS